MLSIGIYVALPLVAGYYSRKWLIRAKGEAWFKDRFLHVLTPVTIIALLITLVLLFSFKGDVILGNPLTILWIAIPLFIQTNLIFWLGYWLARVLKLSYEDAAPSAMIGASNHFEVAIATATMLFGLSSGAALATVVGRAHRGAGDAVAGEDLPEDEEVVCVTSGTSISRAGCTAAAVAVALCLGGCDNAAGPGERPSREDAIPDDAVKVTPETDVFPPVVHDPAWSDPVPVAGPVNTAGAEDSPFIAPDGGMFLFWFTPDVTIPGGAAGERRGDRHLVRVTGRAGVERADVRRAERRELP